MQVICDDSHLCEIMAKSTYMCFVCPCRKCPEPDRVKEMRMAEAAHIKPWKMN